MKADGPRALGWRSHLSRDGGGRAEGLGGWVQARAADAGEGLAWAKIVHASIPASANLWIQPTLSSGFRGGSP